MAKINSKVMKKGPVLNKKNNEKKNPTEKLMKKKPMKNGNKKAVVKNVRKVKKVEEINNFSDDSDDVSDEGVLDNGFTVEKFDSASKKNMDDEGDLSNEEELTDEDESADDDNDDLGSVGSDDAADHKKTLRRLKKTGEHESDNDEDDNDDEDLGSVGGDEAEDHKKALERLKETDPEFYQYLAENDQKLLNFNLSDDENEDDDDPEENYHKPSGDLEVASDESDYEPEDGEKEVDSRLVTLKMLKNWQSEILTDKSNRTIGNLVHAFHAAMLRVSVDEEDKEGARYKVDGSAVFNGVIQLCVLELGPAIRLFLGLKSSSKQPPHKCRKFSKIKVLLKTYFTDLLKLLSGVTSSNILNVILKHLHYISPLAVSYPNVVKLLVKKLVFLWGTAEESVRVVAFLCILRITHNQQQNLLDSVLRSMYMTYVKNSKFVSVNTLSGINFMRRSLVEMYALDLNLTYQHAFLFIRQLAINLRNAITNKKKENIHAVYNWQFINSLRLWGTLLGVTCNKAQLQPLIYPLVQICLGTIKLIPTAQYFPLRFHILQVLMDLSRDTTVFVPVLPFILEVLTIYDFNKKHQKQSMKPLNFTCLLRLSKSQLVENTFKDTSIDVVYGALLEYLSTQSHSLAFPDLVLIVKVQLKAFLKSSNIASYKRKVSQLLEKIESNIKFIENERNKVSFNLCDFKQIEAWETILRNKGTPLSTFYENWSKLRNIKKSKELTENEEIGDYNLPILKKTKLATQLNESEDNGKVELFPSDSEDDEDGINLGEGEEKKRKRGKRGSRVSKKSKGTEVEDDDKMEAIGDDIVEDLNVDDW